MPTTFCRTCHAYHSADGNGDVVIPTGAGWPLADDVPYTETAIADFFATQLPPAYYDRGTGYIRLELTDNWPVANTWRRLVTNPSPSLRSPPPPPAPQRFFGAFTDYTAMLSEFFGRKNDNAIVHDGPLPELLPGKENVIVAFFDHDDSDDGLCGEAVVIYKRGNQLYEVHAAFDSFTGLVGKWNPSKITKQYLRNIIEGVDTWIHKRLPPEARRTLKLAVEGGLAALEQPTPEPSSPASDTTVPGEASNSQRLRDRVCICSHRSGRHNGYAACTDCTCSEFAHRYREPRYLPQVPPTNIVVDDPVVSDNPRMDQLCTCGHRYGIHTVNDFCTCCECRNFAALAFVAPAPSATNTTEHADEPEDDDE